MVCETQKSAQWHIDRAKRIVIKMPQKLTTTACFIQEESSGGLQQDRCHLVVICSIYTFWCKNSLSATLCWRAPIGAKQLSTVAGSEFGHSYVSFVMGQSLIKNCDMQMSCVLVRDWLVYYIHSYIHTYIHIYIYIYTHEIVLVCEIQIKRVLNDIYRQSEKYSHKMPKNLPLQPVSSKRNLQVIDSFENMWAVFMLKEETWGCCH